TDAPPFFLSTHTGSIFYADDMGHCSESIFLNSPILSMMVFEYRDMLVVVNQDLVCGVYKVDADGRLTGEMEVKLSTPTKPLSNPPPTLHFAWIG
ncbi:hypothetical protein HK104_008054, partial [Borealophlyctis nickersoniae]